MRSPAVERQPMRDRSVSVISIDSDSNSRVIVQTPFLTGAATSLMTPRNGTDPRKETIYIDLRSDGDDEETMKSPKRDIEGTPDVEQTLKSQRRLQSISDDDLRIPPKRGLKHKVHVVSDDDDVLEEADGNAWKKASQSTQASSSDETRRSWE